MRRSTRWLYCAVLIGFLAAACAKDSPDDITFRKGPMPDEVFTDFVTQESDSGLARWRLTAPKANRFTKRKLVMLESPVIEFFDGEGNRRTTLASESGEYMEDTRDMLAFGNVVVRSVDGDVLETDSLLWKNSSDRIVSESFVRFTRGKDVVTGIGLECDPELTSVDIKRNVKATLVDTDGNGVD